jgi:phosphoribosyl-AMP cyclohydrolase
MRAMTFDPSTLHFNEHGLIPAIAQAHDSGEVLMLAWMNADSILHDLENRVA